MSSPLPVPSKAALRALRGLVLGTSCTLALITEDRRRRIDHALKILENGERVKAARNYRAGGGEQLVAASVSALDVDGVAASFDPTFFRLHPQPGPAPQSPVETSELLQDRTEVTRVRARKRRDDTKVAVHEDVDPEHSAGDVLLTDSNQQPAAVTAPDPFSVIVDGSAESKSRPSSKSSTPDWGIEDIEQRHGDAARAGTNRKRTAGSTPWGAKRIDRLDIFAEPGISIRPKPASAPCPTIQKYAFPSNVRIVAMIHKACDSGNSSEVTGALQHALSAYKAGVAPRVEDKEWVTACALLCRTSQKLGQVEAAAELLTQALREKISEETYFAFDPRSLITALLEQVSLEGRGTSLKILDTCIALFLPKFTEKPQRKMQQLFDLGKALMEHEFKLDRLLHTSDLYLRCTEVQVHSGVPGFTEWVIDNLHQRGGYKRAIRLFYTKYVDMSPSAVSIEKVCDVVVKSVEAAHNYNPEAVLRAMIKLSGSSGLKLRTGWVMRLLICHWKRHGSLEGVEALLDELATAGFWNIVSHPDGVCRVMVEIALEAGDVSKVDHYIAEGTSLKPEFAQHPSLMGRLALFDAKTGNWEAVKQCFVEMDSIIGNLKPPESIRAANKARSNCFVAILKVYAAEHTVQETEQFLKLYIDQLRVPLSPFMVPLVAKHYGALRDFSALSKWLTYCAGALPKVTPEFGNAILSSCRRANMPFPSLRALFHKLKGINPNFVDRVSERIMLNAALSVSSPGGRMTPSRIRSLGIDADAHANHHARKRRCASEGEVRQSMKQLLTCGRPGEALLVYKRALHLGMPLHVLSLRLAVLAQLRCGKFGQTLDECFDKAWRLVQSAQAGGCEVDVAANLLLSKQLRAVFSRNTRRGGAAADHAGEVVFEDILKALDSCENMGIRIDDRTLNQAGLVCLEQRQARGALLFAEHAAERVGIGRCYNSTNFRVFMLAYAELFDVEGLSDCVERAMAAKYWVEGQCRDTLRAAKLRMQLSKRMDVGSERRAFCDGIVKEALGRAVEGREDFRERRGEFEEFALRFMREAAADAAAAVTGDSGQLVVTEKLPEVGGGAAGKEALLGAAPWIVGEHGEEGALQEEEEKDGLLLETLEELGKFAEPKEAGDLQASPVGVSRASTPMKMIYYDRQPPLSTAHAESPLVKRAYSEKRNSGSIETADDEVGGDGVNNTAVPHEIRPGKPLLGRYFLDSKAGPSW